MFHKVKSHANIRGNNVIDKLVRNAAHKITYKPNHFDKIPYPVILTQIHQFANNSGRKQWSTQKRTKSNPNKWINKLHHKLDMRIHLLINVTKLNRHQCVIIIRPLTEHIELSLYLFKLQIKCFYSAAEVKQCLVDVF